MENTNDPGRGSYDGKCIEDALEVLQKRNVGSSFMVNSCIYELLEEGETSVKITTGFCVDGHTESKI